MPLPPTSPITSSSLSLIFSILVNEIISTAISFQEDHLKIVGEDDFVLRTMETKQAVGESRVSDKGELVVGSGGDDSRVLVEDHDEDDEDGDWEEILMREFGKVDVVEKANATTKMGTLGLATALQAATAMMRLDRG